MLLVTRKDVFYLLFIRIKVEFMSNQKIFRAESPVEVFESISSHSFSIGFKSVEHTGHWANVNSLSCFCHFMWWYEFRNRVPYPLKNSCLFLKTWVKWKWFNLLWPSELNISKPCRKHGFNNKQPPVTYPGGRPRQILSHLAKMYNISIIWDVIIYNAHSRSERFQTTMGCTMWWYWMHIQYSIQCEQCIPESKGSK